MQVAKPSQEVSQMSLLDLFCSADDFWQATVQHWTGPLLGGVGRKRKRAGVLHPSEVRTSLIHFHQSHYRDFKASYTQSVQVHLRAEFPQLVSDNRFVEQTPTVLLALVAYVRSHYGAWTGISFVDSTPLARCDNHRSTGHKVFADLARRGKTSMGWCYGFKLHLVVNDCGELLRVCLTEANVHATKPVPKLAARLFGKRFADRGYISQKLAAQLLTNLVGNSHARCAAP